jgi:hypothetical protein
LKGKSHLCRKIFSVMKKLLGIFLLFFSIGCKEQPRPSADAQKVVDKAIEASGGGHFQDSRIQFNFRDRKYVAYRENGRRILKRITQTDTALIEDVKSGASFERIVNGVPQQLADTTRQKLSDAVNSVHYFAYLPYGLNDAAVNKAYLGEVKIGDSMYHKIQVTFDQEGGGTDFEDIFVYWFNTDTHLPDYLAYEYHTNGGGMRFRKAYNERKVGGIRFVDYRNFKYEGPLPVTSLDSLYLAGDLELLSRIALEDIEVSPDSYN